MNWTRYIDRGLLDALRQGAPSVADIRRLVDYRWQYGADPTREDAVDYVVEFLDGAGLLDPGSLSEEDYAELTEE